MDGVVSTTDVRKAAKITVVFLSLYSVTFINTIVTKKRLLQRARSASKVFDRYSSPEMRNADRLGANFLEWSPIFLGLVWCLAATGNLSPPSYVAAWAYVILRALYIVLLLKHGVAPDGANKQLWISTLPAYFCLVYLWFSAIGALWF